MKTQNLMVNITLAIPDELHKKLKFHSEIRWSEVIRKMLEQRLDDFEEMEKIVSKSKLTQKDADEISKKIKRGIAKRHGLI